MKPVLRSLEIASLPKLAWVASLNQVDGTVEVLHGSGVERRRNWVVEGVWDRDFSDGEFHRSDSFFGSGIRIEQDEVHFVPSSALVDRLVYCSRSDRLLVSNSLVLLLGFTGAMLDKNHDYRIESNAICKGIRHYKKEIPVLHGDISHFCQLFYDSMVVANGHVSFRSRGQVRSIRSYDDYTAGIRTVLEALKRNSESSSRTHRLSIFSTLSSGYDSVAVTCLARDFGVSTCFASAGRSKWKPSYWVFRNTGMDDSQPIANALGLRVLPLCAPSPTKVASADRELRFYAASCASFELIFDSMAEHIERSGNTAVVFTGYHGDKVWDVNVAEEFWGDDMRRGDISGLTLAEARLKSGFINAALPFVMARNIREIVEISGSRTMTPWRLWNSYDRPIPRRIAESAGVSRTLFGMRKNAAWRSRSFPVNRVLRREFFRFIRQSYQISPATVVLAEKANRLTFICEASVRWLVERSAKRLRWRVLPKAAATLIPPRRFLKDKHLNRQLFIWATNRLSAATAETLRQRQSV